MTRIAGQKLGEQGWTADFLQPEYNKTLALCMAPRQYVDKYVAHMDLRHALGDITSEVTRNQTTDAVNAICRFVEQFHANVRKVSLTLLPVDRAGQEQQFLLRLYQGNQAEKALETAALGALRNSDWQGSKRSDIPSWIWDEKQADTPLGSL